MTRLGTYLANGEMAETQMNCLGGKVGHSSHRIRRGIQLAHGKILLLLVLYLTSQLPDMYSSLGRSSACIGERDEADEESPIQGKVGAG